MIKDIFVARKHGKEREPWVQKSMPIPPKSTKKKDDEEFERFAEILRPVFLHNLLTDILKNVTLCKVHERHDQK